MTRANVAAFKSKVQALADTLKLSGEELVAVGLSLAVTHAGGRDRQSLHADLDQHLNETRGNPTNGEGGGNG